MRRDRRHGYEFPYEWYDTAADRARVDLREPARRDGLHAVVDDDGTLISFWNFVRVGDEVRVGLGIARTSPTGSARSSSSRASLREGRVVASASVSGSPGEQRALPRTAEPVSRRSVRRAKPVEMERQA